MALSEEDERRVEAEMRRLTAELRFRPNQEKEDRIGVEIGLMPEEERAFVPIALLRQLVHEREGTDLRGRRRGVAAAPAAAAPPSSLRLLRLSLDLRSVRALVY